MTSVCNIIVLVTLMLVEFGDVRAKTGGICICVKRNLCGESGKIFNSKCERDEVYCCELRTVKENIVGKKKIRTLRDVENPTDTEQSLTEKEIFNVTIKTFVTTSTSSIRGIYHNFTNQVNTTEEMLISTKSDGIIQNTTNVDTKHPEVFPQNVSEIIKNPVHVDLKKLPTDIIAKIADGGVTPEVRDTTESTSLPAEINEITKTSEENITDNNSTGVLVVVPTTENKTRTERMEKDLFIVYPENQYPKQENASDKRNKREEYEEEEIMDVQSSQKERSGNTYTVIDEYGELMSIRVRKPSNSSRRVFIKEEETVEAVTIRGTVGKPIEATRKKIVYSQESHNAAPNRRNLSSREEIDRNIHQHHLQRRPVPVRNRTHTHDPNLEVNRRHQPTTHMRNSFHRKSPQQPQKPPTNLSTPRDNTRNFNNLNKVHIKTKSEIHERLKNFHTQTRVTTNKPRTTSSTKPGEDSLTTPVTYHRMLRKKPNFMRTTTAATVRIPKRTLYRKSYHLRTKPFSTTTPFVTPTTVNPVEFPTTTEPSDY